MSSFMSPLILLFNLLHVTSYPSHKSHIHFPDQPFLRKCDYDFYVLKQKPITFTAQVGLTHHTLSFTSRKHKTFKLRGLLDNHNQITFTVPKHAGEGRYDLTVTFWNDSSSLPRFYKMENFFYFVNDFTELSCAVPEALVYEKKPNNSEPSHAIIIGCVVGAVILIIVLFIWFKYRNRSKLKKEEVKDGPLRIHDIIEQSRPPSPVPPSKPTDSKSRTSSAKSIIRKHLHLKESPERNHDPDKSSFKDLVSNKLKHIKHKEDSDEDEKEGINEKVMNYLRKRSAKARGKMKMIEHTELERLPSLPKSLIRYISSPPKRFGGASSKWTPPASTGGYYKALISFRKELPDELSLRRADVVVVDEFYEDGWVKVRKVFSRSRQNSANNSTESVEHISRQDTGVVPFCYLQPVESFAEELFLHRSLALNNSFSMMMK